MLRNETSRIPRDLCISLQEEEVDIGNQRDGRTNSFNTKSGTDQETYTLQMIMAMMMMMMMMIYYTT
jgi:hypothetical protein